MSMTYIRSNRQSYNYTQQPFYHFNKQNINLYLRMPMMLSIELKSYFSFKTEGTDFGWQKAGKAAINIKPVHYNR